MTDPVVNGNRGRREPIEREGGASVVEHGLEEVDGLGRVAEVVFPRLDSARLRLKESQLRLDSDL